MKFGVIALTQGNISNSHFYLNSIMNLFPLSSVGGSSLAQQATQLLEINYGFGRPVLTDIAEDKKIFRKRAWVKKFFEIHDLKAGDLIVVEHIGSFRFHIYPKRD